MIGFKDDKKTKLEEIKVKHNDISTGGDSKRQ